MTKVRIPIKALKNEQNEQKWKYIFPALLLMALVATGCASTKSEIMPSTPEVNVVLTVSGSGSATAVLSAIQPAFEADTPGYRLNVLSGSSTGGGVKGVIEGVLDVAAMARPPKAEETAQEIAYVEIGRAGQAVIIHPDISLTNLTSAQIIAIFTGRPQIGSKSAGRTSRSSCMYAMRLTPAPRRCARRYWATDHFQRL